MPRALVTGSGGFIGSYLVPFLKHQGYETLGTYLHGEKVQDKDKGRFESMDMRDRVQVKELIHEWKPDLIVHLAAQSLVMPSWDDPVYTAEVNVLGMLYLLEAVRQVASDPLILLAGTSAQYGWSYQEEIPVGENRELRPTSPYAATKVGAEALAYAYFSGHKFRIVRMRLFNVTGAGKAEDACSDFARGIAELEKHDGGILEVGNLDTIRDISDVRDVVRAMWILIQNGIAGEAYNICSGKGTRIGDILDMLIRMTVVPVEVRRNSKRQRPSDEPIFVGDNSKISALGWQPEIPIERTLSDLLGYWRSM